MLNSTVLCRTLGRACGIGEYAIYLAERLQGNAIAAAGELDPENAPDVIFVQFEHGLYPNGRTELYEELDELKRRAPKAFLVVDYHSLFVGLDELRWKTLVGVKNGFVEMPKGVFFLPHLAIQPQGGSEPPPEEIHLGAFGFANPFKEYEKVIDLAIRLDVPLTLIASVPRPTDQAAQEALPYVWSLQQRVAGHPKIELINKFMPLDECLAKLKQCSHIVSAMRDDYGAQGGPSGSLRVAVASGRPVVAVRTGRSVEVGATLVDSLDSLTIDWLKSHREPSHVADGFHVYENLMNWLQAAKSVEKEILHHDAIYDELIQFERISWVKDHIDHRSRAIDIGIGNGWTTNFLGCRAGVEIWPERQRYAQIRYPHIDFFLNDMSEPQRGYDTVVFAEVIEHVSEFSARITLNSWAAYSDVKQMLITTPNAGKKDYDPGIVHNPEHEWFPTIEKLQAMCPPGFTYRELTTTSGEDFILADLRRI